MERLLWTDNSHRRRVSSTLLAVLALLAVLLSGWTQTVHAGTYTASLDRYTITLGESATLSLKFDGGSPNDPPNPPDIANLQFNYVGPSSQFSFINGRTMSSVTYNYTITPRQAGDYTIPSIKAEVGGQTVASQPLKLTVVKPSAPSSAAITSGKELAFLRLLLPKKEMYQGEVVTAELELFLRDFVRGVGNFQLTPLPANGFSVGKMTQGQERRVQIGNAVYRMVPLTFVLTAVKSGTMELGPVTASAVLQIPSSSRSRDPFFEQFGIRSPFSDFNTEQKQVSLATEAEPINVLPLPKANVPPSFNGAVGQFTMNVTAGPTNVTVGDPITVRVEISGRGALDTITLPQQAAWKDFKTYPPTSKLETQDKFGLQGTKTFEEIVAPQNSDIHELPGFAFSFFDPDAKAYRTLTQPPVSLEVRPGSATPLPQIAATKPNSPNQPPPQDIIPIKQNLGELAQVGPPVATQTWFLALQGVPLLAWIGAFVWRKRTEALANNPRLRRQRHVAHLLREGQARLRQLASENNSEEFFAQLFHLLQEVLGERLDVPANSITEAVVEDQLRPRGLPETTLDALHGLFQAGNLARYAPVRTSQELAAVIPRFEAVVDELQKLKV